jgi:hypothetical protein
VKINNINHNNNNNKYIKIIYTCVPNWIHNQRLHGSTSQPRISICASLCADIFFTMSVCACLSVFECECDRVSDCGCLSAHFSSLKVSLFFTKFSKNVIKFYDTPKTYLIITCKQWYQHSSSSSSSSSTSTNNDTVFYWPNKISNALDKLWFRF